MVYESQIPVGLWECLCSTGMTVKQIPECHTLLTGKHTLAGLYGRHSDRVDGLTASPAQNFWSNQIRYRKPGLSRNTTGSSYIPNKVHLRLVGGNHGHFLVREAGWKDFAHGGTGLSI